MLPLVTDMHCSHGTVQPRLPPPATSRTRKRLMLERRDTSDLLPHALHLHHKRLALAPHPLCIRPVPEPAPCDSDDEVWLGEQGARAHQGRGDPSSPPAVPPCSAGAEADARWVGVVLDFFYFTSLRQGDERVGPG